MVRTLTRAIALFAAGIAPVLAGGLHAHTPLPPPRPVFPGDPMPGTLPPDAEQPAEEAAQAPMSAPAPVDVPPPSEARVDLPQPPYDPVPTEPAPAGFDLAENTGIADLTRKYAARHGVPLQLLHTIIMRESRYRPHLVNRRYYGLMQITTATARGMGYTGSPKGLLNAETNLAYATPYLANAWALADGDMSRAVRLYAAGYHYTAKTKGMLGAMRNAHSPPVKPEPPALPEQATLAAPPPPQTGFLDSLFAQPAR
jgi:hypothetical protein